MYSKYTENTFINDLNIIYSSLAKIYLFLIERSKNKVQVCVKFGKKLLTVTLII